ncbi:MAG: S-methyl-5-thioribose-1-phosphate isomerase [Kiloniellales bacterium]|nr:S-methyl-5-thioribose-1-phosphate isomerase [Kiloniellales bacterium]
MKVQGKAMRSIALSDDGWGVDVIDQTLLPHRFEIKRLETLNDAADAIRGMVVRGAPLIGATASYGMALAMRDRADDTMLEEAASLLLATRPTAVNLRWAVDAMKALLAPLPPQDRPDAAYKRAHDLCEEDVQINAAIGRNGLKLIEIAADRKSGERVEVLTHCNAGWLATVDWGTALAPLYMAHDSGIPVHVWVDETRPRNQGSGLTAWELSQHGVPHTVIADNVGGHLMQHGKVDLCITGTDRTTARGDVCNKIGTYLKALAAQANDVPFYVALPGPTIDWTLDDGLAIPIEERDGRELSEVSGVTRAGDITTVRTTPKDSPVANFAFDVTPANLVSALITERGVCPATKEGLLDLYPERRGA